MDSTTLESYRMVAGAALGGLPLFLGIIVGYTPYWLKGFATKRPAPVPAWWLRAVIAAVVVLDLAGLAAFMLYLRSSEGESLLHEDFWSGLRDGAVGIGGALSLIVYLLLLLVRAIVNAARGGKPYKPHEELNVTQVHKMAKQERETLREALSASSPVGPARAQATECLELADDLFQHRHESGGSNQYGKLLEAIVLCRVGGRALASGAPVAGAEVFCWPNPLHDPAVATRELPYADQGALPRPLCSACLEALDSGTMLTERILVLPQPNNGSYPQTAHFYLDVFEHDRPTNLDTVMARVRRNAEFHESRRRGSSGKR